MQVVKRLWEYIKAHDLQDPENKRKIIPDEKMLTLFTPPLDQLNMNKQLTRHILPKGGWCVQLSRQWKFILQHDTYIEIVHP